MVEYHECEINTEVNVKLKYFSIMQVIYVVKVLWINYNHKIYFRLLLKLANSLGAHKSSNGGVPDERCIRKHISLSFSQISLN